MVIYRLYTISPLFLKEAKTNNSNKFDFKEQSSFLNWLTGFTDAEGNFLISLDRGYIRFRFKISMHIDNFEALNTIKSILNVGSVTMDKDINYCSFVVQNFSDIRDVICPALWPRESLQWDKLSNSGDTLKPLIPTYSVIAIADEVITHVR